MLFLKKAWVWIKKHWYVPLLFLLVAAGGIAGIFGWSKNKQLIKMLEINKKSYEAQIKVIEDSHVAEMKKKDDLYTKYVETMKKINKQHGVDISNLEKEKKKKLDKMVKKYKGTPEELAKELSEMFGVEYVE